MRLLKTLKSVLKIRSRSEIELEYLNEAITPADLEMRQREIDRGRFRHLSNIG